MLPLVPLTCFPMAAGSLPCCHGCILVASRLNPGGICGCVEEAVDLLEPLPEYVPLGPWTISASRASEAAGKEGQAGKCPAGV